MNCSENICHIDVSVQQEINATVLRYLVWAIFQKQISQLCSIYYMTISYCTDTLYDMYFPYNSL